MYGYQRGKWEREINWEFGDDIYTTVFKRDNQQGPNV